MVHLKINITVDWYNEPDLRNAWMDIKSVPTPFLYLGLGKVKYQRKKMLQIFGCSNSLSGVMSDTDVRLIAKEREVWLGFISSSEFTGQIHLAGKSPVRYAKSIYQKALKFRYVKSAVNRDLFKSAKVFNRWWKIGSNNSRIASPNVYWPDVIEYNALDASTLTLKLTETQDSLTGSICVEDFETLPPHLKNWE